MESGSSEIVDESSQGMPFDESHVEAPSPAVVFRKACPLCNGGGNVAFAKAGIPIVDCAACSHRFADYSAGAEHVGNLYGDSYFEGVASEYAGYELEARALRERGAWYGRLLRSFLPDGKRLLDVGAASGHILEGLSAAGWTGIGIEPNATMAERARARGVDVRESTIEELALTDKVDAVTMVQVLPHILDLRAAIVHASAVTIDGGTWVIETWDRESLVARILGARWHEYNPPSVLHWFSKASLRALLAEYGFAYLESGRPPKSISGAHAKALLTSDSHTLVGRAIGGAARLLPDGFTIPYPGDDVFWMAFRKQAEA